MTTPANVSIQDCNTEMGRTATLATSMNAVGIRSIAGVPMSGAYNLSSAANRKNYAQTMTVGQHPSSPTVYGYSSGALGVAYGNCLPSVMLPLNEIIYQMNGVDQGGGTGTFGIIISGNEPANAIYRIDARLAVNNDPFLVFDANLAVYSSGGGQTIWNWPAGTSTLGNINWPALNGATVYWNIYR